MIYVTIYLYDEGNRPEGRRDRMTQKNERIMEMATCWRRWGELGSEQERKKQGSQRQEHMGTIAGRFIDLAGKEEEVLF